MSDHAGSPYSAMYAARLTAMTARPPSALRRSTEENGNREDAVGSGHVAKHRTAPHRTGKAISSLGCGCFTAWCQAR
ncbi:hypothetical protein [Streptomyces sp. NPDC003996]